YVSALTVLPVGHHFFFSSRRRHTRSKRDWSSDVCSSDLFGGSIVADLAEQARAQIVDVGIPLGHGANDHRIGHRIAADDLPILQIGRASCRERLQRSEGAVALKRTEMAEQKSASSSNDRA